MFADGGLASDCFGSKTKFAVLLLDACFAPHARTRFAGGAPRPEMARQAFGLNG